MAGEQRNFDIAVVGTMIVSIVGAIESLEVDKGVAALWGAGGAVVTAIIGYWKARSADANARKVATIAADAALATNAKSVFVERVTAERAVWRRELRDHGAELVALLRWSAHRHSIDWHRVLRLCSEISMRLNPSGRDPDISGEQKHALDRQIHALLDEILLTSAKRRADHQRIGDALEIAIAKLLKQEWDKSKIEALDGKLAN